MAELTQNQAMAQLLRLREKFERGSFEFTKDDEAEKDELLVQLYAARNDKRPVFFYHHDANGYPRYRLRNDDVGGNYEMLFQNQWNASEWQATKMAKPSNWTGAWPPKSLWYMLSKPDVSDYCSSCYTHTPCKCNYEGWSQRLLPPGSLVRIKQVDGVGQALFAARDFERDNLLGEYTGMVTALDEEESDMRATMEMGPPVREGETQPVVYVDAGQHGCIWRYLKHSDEANVRIMQTRVGMNRQLLVVCTNRRIRKGEMLTEYNPDIPT